jgi:hypothetical protein
MNGYNNFIAWLGVSKDDIKKLYQEEITVLMPKTKPAKDDETAGEKKAAAKKPAKAKKQ